MTEYPPEVQAVLDAAVRMADTDGYQTAYPNDIAAIRKAVAAYCQSTAPPEPFDVLIHKTSIDDLVSPAAMQALVFNDRPRSPGELWRCTVTPVERVR